MERALVFKSSFTLSCFCAVVHLAYHRILNGNISGRISLKLYADTCSSFFNSLTFLNRRTFLHSCRFCCFRDTGSFLGMYGRQIRIRRSETKIRPMETAPTTTAAPMAPIMIFLVVSIIISSSYSISSLLYITLLLWTLYKEILTNS